MSPGMKLTVGALVVVVAVGYLGFLGAASSWQYYLSVDESVSDLPELIGKQVRIAGRVASGSLQIADDRSQATFDLAGERHVLRVACRGPLPDNLAEEIDVVVEGTLRRDGVEGERVITRCASKYESVTAGAAPNSRDSGPSA